MTETARTAETTKPVKTVMAASLSFILCDKQKEGNVVSIAAKTVKPPKPCRLKLNPPFLTS